MAALSIAAVAGGLRQARQRRSEDELLHADAHRKVRHAPGSRPALATIGHQEPGPKRLDLRREDGRLRFSLGRVRGHPPRVELPPPQVQTPATALGLGARRCRCLRAHVPSSPARATAPARPSSCLGSGQSSSASGRDRSSQARQSERSSTTTCRSWMGATSGPGLRRQHREGGPAPSGIGRHSPAKQNQSSPALVNLHFDFGDFPPGELEEMRGRHEAAPFRKPTPLGAEVDHWRTLWASWREAPAKLRELAALLRRRITGAVSVGQMSSLRFEVRRGGGEANRNPGLAERLQIGV